MTFKREYQILYTHSSRDDMRNMKKYILQHFQYRELAENFTRKMKKAARELANSPIGYKNTGFLYRGYIVYIKPSDSYLFFFVVNKTTKEITILRVLQDGMNWEYVFYNWLKKNK